MFKTLIAAAALFAIPAVASAEEAPKASFSYNGVTYSYTTETKGDLRVLRGTADQGRQDFVLRVSKYGVTCNFGSQPVDFSLRDVKHLNETKMVAIR